MGNSLRFCIACVLPCGALDVVRILHADGRVDVHAGGVMAGDVMKAYPKHVLGLPSCQNLVQKPTILHPDTELQKGKIYFLIPTYSLQKRPNNNKPNATPIEVKAGHEAEAKPDRRQQQQQPAAADAMQAKTKRPRRASGRPHSQAPKVYRGSSRRVESCKGSTWRPALQSISEADFV